MTNSATIQSDAAPVEAVMRDELLQGDLVLGTIGPILGHLLANHDHSLFSDEIVSRVRGMVVDIARQLLVAEANAGEVGDPVGFSERAKGPLAERLLTDEGLVGHCHTLALEWHLTARLETRNAIDPVLSPLLQALIASDDSPTASAAMAALTAQARFAQLQRRMELPLGELPADHLHGVLSLWSDFSAADSPVAVTQAIATIREGYDESASRLGLLARLVTGMGAGAKAALSIGHAGAAIFLTALAATTQQSRERAVITTNDRQLARLALSLRAAGLKPKEVEEQFLYIHPEVSLPEGFDALRADRAAAMLAEAAR